MSRVELPDHADQTYGHDLLPALLEPGTYAVRPEPSGPPRRPWDEVGAHEAEARGVYLPVSRLPYGPRGTVAIAPGDVRGTVLIPERCDGCCCGLDERNGPNLACEQCGLAVATRVDDCGRWQAVWLDPRAVRPAGVEGPARTPAGWDELRETCPDPPPVEQPGWWSPRWEASVAVALARLLAVSGGRRIVVPDGPVAGAFRKALDTLLPPGPSARNLVLAGPGLSVTTADIALVPRHPQTGRSWQCDAGSVVPLAAGVWVSMAFHDDRRLAPAAAGMPDAVRRDDPPPPLPCRPFLPDLDVFLRTLARLPAAREPWLRAVHDRVRDRRHTLPCF
ncbi:hypothetical protein ABGB14_38220 [Nonomuraea sp. B10E15]|uniref:hypothetical protein n=1 Tax=Nonomuraea sp. B10E15 TaxID=3153560 RepID=UPI00325D412D